MQRTVGRWAALAAAVLAGYVAGVWNGHIAVAAKDPSRELIEADHAFDAATSSKGMEGWVAWFAPDAIMMPAGQNMIVGQTAIHDFVSKAFASPGFAMRWEPVDAGASGDLGYTYGVSKTTRPGANGKTTISYGKYLTIWRKQRDHSWKVALDIGNASPPPAAPKP
jgi:ketosteroid isomerase-like protein